MERIITLPDHVRAILAYMESCGYEAYVVGGCVRDSLMGIEPHDWDICTSATPEQVKEIFWEEKVLDTGLQHGTVSLVLDGTPYEITTFRKDGTYTDGRRPDAVEFVDDITTDLSRRDFTINAMAYNPNTGIIDPFSGIEDIQNRIIRCVGNPYDRFKEDALRIMRALRFAIRFQFTIDQQTKSAMSFYGKYLKCISKERICDEITKILSTDVISKYNHNEVIQLRDLLYMIDKEIFFCVNDLEETPLDLPIRCAVMFASLNLKNSMTNLRFPKQLINETGEIFSLGSKLILDVCINTNIITENIDYYVRKFMNSTKYTDVFSVIKYVKIVDERNLEAYDILQNRIEECINRNLPYKISHLAVNGNDMLSIGAKGEQIGSFLEFLLDEVIRGSIPNEKEYLMSIAKSRFDPAL